MKKKIFWMTFCLVVVIIMILVGCDMAVSHNALGKMYENTDSIPHCKVGLVLGTSPVSTWTGRRNYYFDKRIQAASDLYNSGKVDWLIVSGGDYRNSEENGYDEPMAMRDSLIKNGVDSVRIILDYDGTRTLNSIAKVRNVYHQDSIVIISQKYHNERALFQAKHLGVSAIAYNANTPVGKGNSVWWRNRGRETFARVKLFMDICRDVQPDIKETLAWDFTDQPKEWIRVENVCTPFGDLLCLAPDMDNLMMDMICGSIPDARNDSIVLAFAGAFTGTMWDAGHGNIAGNHVAGGTLYRGYKCKRNTGAFTWSKVSGHKFHYLDYLNMLVQASTESGMGFAQEMMIHNGIKVETTRPLENRNQFRALCQDCDGKLLIYESQGIITFGNFIDALLDAGVTEAIYTDMGPGWNYCFYRQRQGKPASFIHNIPQSDASNFIVFRIKIIRSIQTPFHKKWFLPRRRCPG